jgi:hypothetical protein
MNRRAARLLTSLYPRPWRDRYGAEFEAFLVAGPRGLRAFTNVALSAFCEHLFPLGGFKMNRLPRSLGAILCAYLVVIAAGINFYLTIDDSSLAAAMRANPGLSTAWNVVAFGSVAALLGAIAMLVPLAIGAFRFALREKRRDVLFRLLAPPLAAGLLAAWVIGAFVFLGRHWAPLPWAVLGDFAAPADWPSLPVRWLFAGLTSALAAALLAVSSIGMYQAIQRTRFLPLRFTLFHRPFTIHPLRFARIPGMILTAAMAVMTLGVLAWGLAANLNATSAFRAYSGPMHTTAIASWMGSICVFAAASAIALRSVPSLVKPAGE